MSIVSSPFLSDMQQCRQAMRKLRKKIYKNCRSTHLSAKKQHDHTEEILNIFKTRNIPEFITEALRKRRNFDLKSIKNISVATLIPLEQIQAKTYHQQQEAASLFNNHKQRMLQLEKREEENRVFGEVMYQMSTENIYSSTNEDEYVIQVDMELQEESQSQPLSALQLFNGGYQQQQEEQAAQKDYFQFNINQSSIHEDLGFLNF